ncbi:MAG: hypothetical protein RIC55_22200 [Pirellulaceae bacterium]
MKLQARKSVSRNPATSRGQGPQHISGLLQLVLARYGITEEMWQEAEEPVQEAAPCLPLAASATDACLLPTP